MTPPFQYIFQCARPNRTIFFTVMPGPNRQRQKYVLPDPPRLYCCRLRSMCILCARAYVAVFATSKPSQMPRGLSRGPVYGVRDPSLSSQPACASLFVAFSLIYVRDTGIPQSIISDFPYGHLGDEDPWRAGMDGPCISDISASARFSAPSCTEYDGCIRRYQSRRTTP